MTIEFHCPFCQKLLKTADDKAGVRANCPGCGESVMVPSPGSEAEQPDPSLMADVAAVPVTRGSDAPPEAPPAAGAEDDAESPGESRPCPMCGARIKRAAKRCRFCGEDLVEDRPAGVPTQIEAGVVLSSTWEIFQKRIGILIGAAAIMLGIGMAVNMVAQVVQSIIQISVLGVGGGMGGGGGRANPDPATLMLVIWGPAVIFGFLNFAINCYIQAGLNRLLLKVARGENVEIAEMFSGGRYYWRFLLANLLFTIMLYVGLLLLIVPGIFVGLMFWPIMYLIVDRDLPVIEAFRRAGELTSGNYMASFVLGLAAMGIQLAGLLACCVGVIATTPFVMLLFAVAYCRMSGQAIART